MKRILSFILVLLLLLSTTACGEKGSFTHCEITLNLTEKFTECSSDEPFVIVDSSGNSVVFKTTSASPDIALSDGVTVVMLSRISHEAAADEGIAPFLTETEFARLYMSLSETEAEIFYYSDTPYYLYEKTGSDGARFTFLVSFFRSPYAYFTLSFITTQDNFETEKLHILGYIDAVKFTG